MKSLKYISVIVLTLMTQFSSLLAAQPWQINLSASRSLHGHVDSSAEVQPKLLITPEDLLQLQALEVMEEPTEELDITLPRPQEENAVILPLEGLIKIEEEQEEVSTEL